MQISSRFTIAIHILTCIETFKNDYKVTSDFLAGSINVNPVVIRRLLSQLKAAGIIEVARGTGGANVARPLKEITMLDVYRAVECVDKGELFHFHENPNVLLGGISIMCWIVSWIWCSGQWRMSWDEFLWKKSLLKRGSLSIEKIKVPYS